MASVTCSVQREESELVSARDALIINASQACDTEVFDKSVRAKTNTYTG